MTQHTLFRFASLIIFILAATASAYAVGPQRTFVSAQTGTDANTANNCSVTQPCRNFNAAIGVVNAGGEVVALDSGGYGVTTINKAVTLTSPSGVYAAITALTAGSSAITVSAASTDTVVLRGLTLTGLGGDNGIKATSVGTLHIEGCVISGFTNNGIDINLTTNASRIYIKDTITRNNGSGVVFQTNTGTVRASVDNCRSEHNGNGFYATDNSIVNINRSVASGNSNTGFYAISQTSGASAELNCQECFASDGAAGFAANAGFGGAATIRVSHSVATNHNVGFAQSGDGVFESASNNMARGNDTNKGGTITLLPPD